MNNHPLALHKIILAAILFALPAWAIAQQRPRSGTQRSAAKVASKTIPQEALLEILKAEDQRSWNNALSAFLTDADVRVRARAALAAGRIGDARAISYLSTMLQSDRDPSARAMAAFALGEIESYVAANSLSLALKLQKASEVRARAIEAVGKIAAAALAAKDEQQAKSLGELIIRYLEDEANRGEARDKEVVLLGLTAAMRARHPGSGSVIARFLSDADARVRADAANALARLQSKEGVDRLRSLLNDPDAIARANAARALASAEDSASVKALMERIAHDDDQRVRVNAIRAVAALKTASAADALIERASELTVGYKKAKQSGIERPPEVNEMLEIATALGRLKANSWDMKVIAWLREFRTLEEYRSPEIEVAFVRAAPDMYIREKPVSALSESASHRQVASDWRQLSSMSQALAEIAAADARSQGNTLLGIQVDAQMILASLLDQGGLHINAVPYVLRAYASFKSGDATEVLRRYLKLDDEQVRATAAELLSQQPREEANVRALAEALPIALKDRSNDAALAILDALGKDKTARANEAIKLALESLDHLIRRRAVSLLKANSAGNFESRVGTVATQFTDDHYRRAIARQNLDVKAVVNTTKGSIAIALYPEAAPLTVDNFIQLARRNFFNRVVIHRVVPNFVIQDGDPRGDGNGGPGYQIRCEINQSPYDRGMVGMALSGKDTGGSQWFVTHSPQPHLDGGYTIFGKVAEGMEVVDRIARGDMILSVQITETKREPVPRQPERTIKPKPRAGARP